MRVAHKPLAAYPCYLRLFFRAQRRRYGALLEPALLWARVPRLFAALALFHGAIDRKSSPLEPALRSLVAVRVSQLNSCAFCIDLNSAMSLGRGAPAEKLGALAQWRDCRLFDERERSALAYAEAMTRSDRRVDDGLMGALRLQFDEAAIVELTALIAFQNMSSKFNSALEVPAQGFCTSRPRPIGQAPSSLAELRK